VGVSILINRVYYKRHPPFVETRFIANHPEKKVFFEKFFDRYFDIGLNNGKVAKKEYLGHIRSTTKRQ